MKLVIDAGNTRLKWQVLSGERVTASGACLMERQELAESLAPILARVRAIAITTVIAEDRRDELSSALTELTGLVPRFHWSEAARGGLRNSYAAPERMGADRWHGMYGAWLRLAGSFVLVDAGSAVTVDYVTAQGVHRGGYILPGKAMMLRGLRQDVARVGFDADELHSVAPGRATSECVHHGLWWMWQAMVQRLEREALERNVDQIVVTGGDATDLLALGLTAIHLPDLVLEGVAAIDREIYGL